MKYSEFKYVRPDTEKILNEFSMLIEEFEKSETAEAETEIIKKINDLWDNINTMRSIAYSNYSNDTLNKSF